MRLALCLSVLLLGAWGATAQDLVSEFQAGRTAYREGRYQEALDRFLVCARLRADDPLVTSWVATAMLANGRYQEAASLLQSLVASHPEDAVAHNNLGIALQMRGMLDAAVVQYEEALARAPEMADAQYNLATAYVALGRLPEAERIWRDRLVAAPGDRTATLSLALVLERGAQYAEARRLLEPEAGAAQEPLFAPHHARLTLLAGDAEAALAEMTELEALRNLPPRVREDFAVALVQAGRTADALPRFEDPSLRDSLTARGLTAYAEALGQSQRWLDMFTVLSQVTRSGDFIARWKPADRAAVFARLAWLADRASDRAAAETNARSALQLDPAQPTALAVLQRLGLAHDELRDLEATMVAGSPALQTIQRYAELACGRAGYQPPPAALDALEQLGAEEATLLNRIAALLLRGGRPQSALDRLARVVAQDESNAVAHNNLGVAYELLGKLEEAAREYALAVRLDPTSKEAQANLDRMPRAGHE